MKSLKIVFIFCCCFISNLTFAQVCTITGKLLDSKTEEPIPFANVFLNNTTLGTVTELTGEFTLKNIRQPAVHELVFSFVGYETYKTKISLTTGELNLRVIRLKPSETVLNTVEVKGSKDVEWEKKIKTFKKIFLGDDVMAAQCTLINPWVINFKDNVGSTMVAYASAPIEIENKALGYKVNFYLTQFTADPTAYSIKGNARFIPLTTEDPKIIKEWESNREKSFFGSSQHLFKSIADHRIQGEGFNVYTDVLGFENSTTRSNQFLSELGKTIIRVDTTLLVSPAAQANTFKIEWKGRVEVHYRKEKIPTTIYRDIRYPISWITAKRNFILVNKDGIPLNPSDIVISGAMSKDRVANMLPLDYMPVSQNQQDVSPEKQVDVFNRLYEKVYVHTDRPYYYPGETIWLKGYMNYADLAMRDSLSATSYVELIEGTTLKVVQSKTLRIDSGSFHCDFILPDTLKPAPYFIRAYTNWNRNYGDDHLYSRYVPVLKLLQKPEYFPFNEPSSDVNLVISTDKQLYHPREKIDLMLQLKDDEGNPIVSNLSMSVTDANQVVEVRTGPIIVEDFISKEIPKPILKPSFPIEAGIAFTAQVIRGDKKKGKINLNIFQTYQRKYFPTETDENGVFSLNGFNFYNKSQFTLKVVKDANGKMKPIKEVQLLPREIPPVIFNFNVQTFPIQRTQTSQRDNSSFEMAAQTKVLQEIMVQSSKTEELTKRSYGKPDYVVLAKDLNTSYGNLLTTLPGKVPGLVVRQDPNGNTIVYISRAGGGSISNAKEVLVMINDVFVGGSPAETLGSINPATVESIEIKTGVNVLYGSQGGSGIVSVYTKTGIEDGVVHEDQSILTVPGYFRPRIFPAPDYSTPKKESDPVDYRSLIYWNPNIYTGASTGSASVSFYATDLGGQYRVEVEGVTEKGLPVRAKYIISVEAKKGE